MKKIMAFIISSDIVLGGKGVTGAKGDYNVNRISGENRYETSLNVCRKLNLSSNTAVITSGENFPDVLSGSALASKMDAPIILTDGANVSQQNFYSVVIGI